MVDVAWSITELTNIPSGKHMREAPKRLPRHAEDKRPPCYPSHLREYVVRSLNVLEDLNRADNVIGISRKRKVVPGANLKGQILQLVARPSDCERVVLGIKTEHRSLGKKQCETLRDDAFSTADIKQRCRGEPRQLMVQPIEKSV
jgi:hypothetical protein